MVDLAVRINHRTSLTGRRRYAPIAEFDSSSLRRSPRLIMQAMLSNRNREVSLGSPSSPVLSRTLQAILKDCSKRSVSVMQGKTEPQLKCSYTGQGHGRAVMVWEQHNKC
jgi:hypothetical protein